MSILDILLLAAIVVALFFAVRFAFCKGGGCGKSCRGNCENCRFKSK